MAYLEAALEENDTELLLAVIGDIARSKGMGRIFQESEPCPRKPLPFLVFGGESLVQHGGKGSRRIGLSAKHQA